MISFQARSGRPFADDHTATKISPLAELNWWNDRGGSQRLAQLVNERRRMQMDVSRFGGPVQRRDFEAKRPGSRWSAAHCLSGRAPISTGFFDLQQRSV